VTRRTVVRWFALRIGDAVVSAARGAKSRARVGGARRPSHITGWCKRARPVHGAGPAEDGTIARIAGPRTCRVATVAVHAPASSSRANGTSRLSAIRTGSVVARRTLPFLRNACARATAVVAIRTVRVSHARVRTEGPNSIAQIRRARWIRSRIALGHDGARAGSDVAYVAPACTRGVAAKSVGAKPTGASRGSTAARLTVLELASTVRIASAGTGARVHVVLRAHCRARAGGGGTTLAASAAGRVTAVAIPAGAGRAFAATGNLAVVVRVAGAALASLRKTCATGAR
jgi:hypothetical protein